LIADEVNCESLKLRTSSERSRSSDVPSDLAELPTARFSLGFPHHA
jgi:hypothetical protein